MNQSCTSCDYLLNVRSYAPFASFGGGFEGDKRGPSTMPGVSSRIAVQIAFNPQTGRMATPVATSSGTTFLPLGTRGMATPKATAIKSARFANGFRIEMDVAGSNPLVPGAPDIDLHLDLSVTQASQRLNVYASLRGDTFPNAEVFVLDDQATARMILTFETSGGTMGPFVYLPGNRQRPMNALCYSFPIDECGRFT